MKRRGRARSPDCRAEPNVPNALVLAVGRGDYYKRDLIEKYLQALIAAGPATYVVFVDDTKQFVGSASGRQVLGAVSVTAVADRFMNDLKKGGEHPFAGIVGLVTELLSQRGHQRRRAGEAGEHQCGRFGDVSDEGTALLPSSTAITSSPS